MPRNRIIYQSEAVYAGPSPATGFHLEQTTTTTWTGVNAISTAANKDGRSKVK